MASHVNEIRLVLKGIRGGNEYWHGSIIRDGEVVAVFEKWSAYSRRDILKTLSDQFDLFITAGSP